MSKNTCRMLGILMNLVSVFLLIGGLYLGRAPVASWIAPVCLAAGLLLLITGTVFYTILKSD